MQSLFSILLSSYREKTTHAFELQCNDKNCGHLYIQQGIPLSCYFEDMQGLDALDLMYRDERRGMYINFKSLDCLAIYSENIQEDNFEVLLLHILEKQKLRKVFKNYSYKKLQDIDYWQ